MPLGKFIKHKQQYQDKYAVEIYVHRALNVITSPVPTSSSSPSSYFIKYKRGAKHHGSSLRGNLRDDRSVRFDNCIFTFPCTLYYNNTTTRDYETKHATLSIYEDAPSEKGQKAIGTVKLNIAEYAKGVGEETGKTYQLTETLAKRKTDLKLQLTLSLKRTYDGRQQPVVASTQPSANPASSTSNPPEPTALEDTTPATVASPPSASSAAPANFLSSIRDSNDNNVESGTSSPPLSSLSFNTAPNGSDEMSNNSSSRPSSPRSQDTADSGISSSPPIQAPFIPLPATPPPAHSSSAPSVAALRAPLRQTSEGLLNTADIARRLASRHPELCAAGSSPPEAEGSEPKEAPHSVHSVSVGGGDKHRRTRSEMPDALRSKFPKFPFRRKMSQQYEDESGIVIAHSPTFHRQSPPPILTTPPPPPLTPTTLNNNNNNIDDVALRNKLEAQERELARLKYELALRQQQDDERFLVDEMVSFMQPTYGPGGVPVSAYIIFCALLHWRAFNPSNGRLLVHLTEAFDRLLIRHKTDADVLLYWLSATSTLLYFFRKELKVISVNGATNTESSVLKKFDEQLFQFASSFFDLYCKLLREQLDVAVSEMLAEAGESSHSQALHCWDPEKILCILDNHRVALENNIPFDNLRQQVLNQDMAYIGGRILNALLGEAHEEGGAKANNSFCTYSHAMGVKMVVVQIEEWLEEKVLWSGSACREKLAAARQAANVMLVNKSSLVQDSVRSELCPALSVPQLVCLLESYTPDEFDPEPVHPGVISSIRSTANFNTATAITSMQKQKYQSLLADLSVGELQTHFTSTGALCDLTNVPLPASVASRPGFAFLQVSKQPETSTW